MPSSKTYLAGLVVAGEMVLMTGHAWAVPLDSIAIVEDELGTPGASVSGFTATVTANAAPEGITVTADIPGNPAGTGVSIFSSVALCDSMGPCVESDFATLEIDPLPPVNGALESFLTLTFESGGPPVFEAGTGLVLETAGPDTIFQNFETHDVLGAPVFDLTVTVVSPPDPVPEPASSGLIVSALGAFFVIRRLRTKAA